MYILYIYINTNDPMEENCFQKWLKLAKAEGVHGWVLLVLDRPTLLSARLILANDAAVLDVGGTQLWSVCYPLSTLAFGGALRINPWNKKGGDKETKTRLNTF